MIKKYTALIVIASALPLPTFAQAPVQASASVAAIPLERLCRADGALDLRFGDRVEGSSKGKVSEPLLRNLDATLQPFDYAFLGYTRYSHSLWTVSYSADFANADDAFAVTEILVDKAEALGWQIISQPGDVEGFYEYSLLSKKNADEDLEIAGTTLSINVDQSSISINCVNNKYSLSQADEAIGKMPVGMIKPKIVDYEPSIASFIDADCDDPAKRILLKADIDANHPGLLSPNWSRGTYEEDLANWKIMKLSESGLADFDTLNGQIGQLVDSTDIVQRTEANLTILKDFTAALEKIVPEDDAKLCKLLVQTRERSAATALPIARPTGEAVTLQWIEVHNLLDAEAQRLGVSFGS